MRQGPRGIELSQAPCAKKVLEKAGMSTSNPSTTPMEVKPKLYKKSTSPSVNATRYHKLIGSPC